MSSKIKIYRAKQHLKELQDIINEFFASNPYKIDTKRDSHTRRLVYYLTDVKDVPPEISLISGDIIQNLRSALDHLAYELFIKETKGKLSGKHIYFPIEKNLETYQKEKGRKTKGISTADIEHIDDSKPYKGGNDILWQIAELNNIDKHRLLITVGSSFGSLDIGARMISEMRKLSKDVQFPDMPFFVKPDDNQFPLKTGDELFIDAPDAEAIPNMQFRFEIVLNEQNIIEGALLGEALQGMISEVEKLIKNFS